ncbi:MAG: TetR/AcrR family transcriptional regulator [Chloroflexi bacterium]|nr:TetR/AcrR family transcriptional regulator [Chloroflexota bacterium]
MRKSIVADAPSKDEKIFAEAVRIFKQKGYHAASMQDLADAVGLQKGSLYHYISSKEELLYKIFERSTGAQTQRLQEIIASDDPPIEKLRCAIQAHIIALCEHLDLYTVYLTERRMLTGRTQDKVRKEAERHARLLEEIIQEGITRRDFRAIDGKIAAHAILGMCNWLYQWYSPDGRLTPQAIAEIFADLAISGLSK